MPLADTNTMIRAVLPKTVASTISRLAKASGKSSSQVVREFLTEVEPQLRRLAGMLEVAKSQHLMFPKQAVAELEAAMDQLSGDVVEVMDRLQNAQQLPLEEPTRRKRTRPSQSVAKRRPGRSRR